ncbi:LytTR family DNA-binding domain-containing protein [Caulobacter sp. KR2-114]|uniref:LytTR family DNA-binding domain-containing protein n=1 Tax=Caulobacter sp. KR2-114 TaxID=3400912 RepID=UPI003C0720E5
MATPAPPPAPRAASPPQDGPSNPLAIGRALLIAVIAGVVLTILAPLGTDAIGLLPRAGYWLGLLVSGTVVSVGGMIVAWRVRWLAERPLMLGLVASVAFSIPFTLVAWAVTGAVFHQGLYDLARIPVFALPTFTVTWVMTALNMLASRVPAQTHAAAQGDAPPRFPERLPPRLRAAAILAVEAQDHYLQVHTDAGRELILMRLSDAVAELEGLEGAQVHRSWWVARAAVADARREERRAILTLTDGSEVPVSRAYVRALREMGWL